VILSCRYPEDPRPWTSSPCRGELRCCHVSLSPGPHLFAEVSSGTATCPMAPGSAFLKGELRRCHMSHGLQQAVDHMNKKRLSCPRHAARLACFQGTLVRYRSACNTCMLLQCVSTLQRQSSWLLLDMTTVVIWPDRMAPRDGPGSGQQSDKTGRLHATDVVQDIICYSYPLCPTA
jgi:hypothetical protein